MEQIHIEDTQIILPYVKEGRGRKFKYAGSSFNNKKLKLKPDQDKRIKNLGCREDCFNCKFEDCKVF